MKRLAKYFITLTGLDITRRDNQKYIAVNISWQRLDNWSNTRVNRVVQFRTKQQFQSWLKSDIAKIDQEYFEKVIGGLVDQLHGLTQPKEKEK